jgi:cytochrome oxidase assembly protein ShyY1
LIDNMVKQRKAGYFVITPFALAGGGWVLVNRGWVPLGASRAQRPAIPSRATRGARPRRQLAESRHSAGHPAAARAAVSGGREFSDHAEIARLLQGIRVGDVRRI